MMVQQNRNAIASTLFLNKSSLSIWITCQYFLTTCWITIHYFLPYIYIYIYIYTLRQKHKTTLKIKKNILFTIFKLWKPDTWKLTHKSKFRIWINSKSFLYASSNLCLLLKFCFDIKIRPMSRTIEYKGIFFLFNVL